MTSTKSQKAPVASGRLLFLIETLRTPKKIGAILPSSKRLANQMAAHLQPERGPVLELGPGTGVFTRAILDKGILPAQLALIENNGAFVRDLANRFPGVKVMEKDATKLTGFTPFGEEKIADTICGLPFLMMNDRQVRDILDGVFSLMRDDGRIFFFTYGRKSSISQNILDQLGLNVRKERSVFGNIPPCHIFSLSRL